MNFVTIFFLIFAAVAVPNLESPEYKWTPVKKGHEVKSFPVTGKVIAQEGAMHLQSARIGGRVISLESQEGSTVKRGEALFRIAWPECISIREERKIALNSKLPDLINTIEQRQHELNIRVTDSGCLVLSDSTGVLMKRNASVGTAFNPGDALAEILESAKLRIEIDIPEKSASLISKGTMVSFQISSLTSFTGHAPVKQVFPLVDEGTHVMKARLGKVELPKETKLNAMVFANVELASGKDCLVVPKTALTLQDSRSWLLKKNTSIARVAVDVIASTQDSVLINPVNKDDLREGDQIATFNVPFLYQEVKKRELHP